MSIGRFALGFAVKKAAPLGALFGLTTETGLLFLPAAAYLVLSDAQGTGPSCTPR